MSENRLTRLQQEHNRTSRPNWEESYEHRSHVSDELCRGFSGDGQRICVLGAGNCNDLDLRQLRASFGEVHLVDLDEDALTAGIAAQGMESDPAIVRHSGVDVTGMWDRLAELTPKEPATDAEIEAILDSVRTFQLEGLPGSFDMVGSICLLSQLVEGVLETVGEQHPRFLEVLQEVRRGHMRTMIDCISPGGYGLLVSDFVSSITLAGLAKVQPANLPNLLAQAIDSGNFFHGLNPFVLERDLKEQSALAERLEHVALQRPWRWPFGDRCYAVSAVKFKRRDVEALGTSK